MPQTYGSNPGTPTNESCPGCQGTPIMFKVEDITLVRTCYACPEQYDAFVGDQQVGYLRLRHGFFTVDVPDHTGDTIYEACPRGDGIFEDDEREGYLMAAKQAIVEWNLRNQPKLIDFDPRIETILEGPYHRLTISEDYDDNPNHTYPVLLFTPHMNNPMNHHHIHLDIKSATTLRDWLELYILKENGEG